MKKDLCGVIMRNKCKRCKIEYEGNICPNCSIKIESSFYENKERLNKRYGLERK